MSTSAPAADAPYRRVATVRVIMADTDAMGIVYHATYLRWFEVGRCELIRQAGLAYVEFSAAGFGLPVIEAQLRYRAPARYDDLVVACARIGKLNRASVTFEYRLLREETDGRETVLCEGSTLHACTDTSGRPVRFPAAALASLQRAQQGL
jgi:acyl-CoA thioester hydrolase